MTLELNKPYLVKRVASNGGVLHYLPMDGFCDDIALDAPVLAKRVASSAGVLHYLIGNQQLAADGKLTLNKPYLAKRVASNAGVLHYLVGGKVCETLSCLDLCSRFGGSDDAPANVYVSSDFGGVTWPVEIPLTNDCTPGPPGYFYTPPGNQLQTWIQCLGDGKWRVSVTYTLGFGYIIFFSADVYPSSLDPFLVEAYDPVSGTTWTYTE